jgi:hypothetical protein
MTSTERVSCNFESLPVELQNKICEHFTLEELFKFNRMQIPGFEAVSLYIDYYIHNQKYKEQSRLKDCMFLLKFEKYYDSIYEHLYDLVSNLGIRFVNDVTNAGGPIGYMSLNEEENPRNIYIIKIEMGEESCITSTYELISVGAFESSNIIYYDSYSPDRRSKSLIIKFNVDKIVSILIDLVKRMRMYNIEIISIQYYKKKHKPNFLLNHTLPEVTFIHNIC